MSDKAVWYACTEAARHAGITQTRHAAHPAPQLGDALTGSRHRSAHDSDAARTWRPGDHGEVSSPVATASARGGESAGPVADLRRQSKPAAISPQRTGMSRPAVEVADILRAQGSRFLDRYRIEFRISASSRPFAPSKTAAPRLWVDISMPVRNAASRPSPITPAVTGTARSARRKRVERWLAAREREAACRPATFTWSSRVPHELNVLGAGKPARVLRPVIHRQCRHRHSNWQPTPNTSAPRSASLSILHTWGQNLLLHPHIHCVIPAGGLSPDHTPLGRSPLSFLSAGQGA